MTIIDALKLPNEYIRIVRHNRWLVHNGEDFVVYEHKFRKRNSVIIYEGKSEDEAVTELLKE